MPRSSRTMPAPMSSGVASSQISMSTIRSLCLFCSLSTSWLLAFVYPALSCFRSRQLGLGALKPPNAPATDDATRVTSFTLGRIPLIPNNAITVDIPPVDPAKDEAEWIAHGQVNQPRKSLGSTTFRQVISLSKIVNSTLQMFFAPSRTISGSLLLEEYNKYIQWFAKLPATVQSVENAPPHVISLQ